MFTHRPGSLSIYLDIVPFFRYCLRFISKKLLRYKYKPLYQNFVFDILILDLLTTYKFVLYGNEYYVLCYCNLFNRAVLCFLPCVRHTTDIRAYSFFIHCIYLATSATESPHNS
jgi:hypothetical protein